eukprot:jgi/Picre1/33850/NNA_001329.t1
MEKAHHAGSKTSVYTRAAFGEKTTKRSSNSLGSFSKLKEVERYPRTTRFHGKSSHEDDPVPGGWYDAGDYLKLNFPLAYSVAMISWGMTEFQKGYVDSGVYCSSKEALRHAVTYLMDCHVSTNEYIGQIGHPGIDHSYWGRAHEQKTSRPKFVWKKGMKAADLFAKVSAALSAASEVFEDDKSFSKSLIQHAKDLYDLAEKSPGKYSSRYKSATKIYSSSGWEDDMAWAAAWLYKVTNRKSYLKDSVKYWKKVLGTVGELG